MYAAADREITGPALGSGAEDIFWVLVCEDEEWLAAEFDAIVSEPTETPTRVIHRPTAGTSVAARPAGRTRDRNGDRRDVPVVDDDIQRISSFSGGW